VALMRQAKCLKCPRPHARGVLLVVGELAKAGLPFLLPWLCSSRIYFRQIIIFRASSEADGCP
jgi:hypothetical protein